MENWKSKTVQIINELNPDKELLEFADNFSNRYKDFAVGVYISSSGNYKIDYQEQLDGSPTNPIRVNMQTGLIRCSRSVLLKKDFAKDYVWFMILWCLVIFEVKDSVLADKITISYYLSKNRSKKILKKLHSQILLPKIEIINNEKRLKQLIKIT